ncbi:MAG: hypothetical protein ACR2NN_26225 [Bryobacteraceae bacterium]
MELHPEKTKIVYCKDGNSRRGYPNEKFEFLGCGFQPWRAKSQAGKYFAGFSPAISGQAGKAVRDTIRSWKLYVRSDQALEDLLWMRLRTCRVHCEVVSAGDAVDCAHLAT